MCDSEKILVAGLGSSHGDDRAGWLIAERLAEHFPTHPRIDVRRAMIPLDLLDWLEGITVLHVCDACETTRRHRTLHRFTWNAGQMIAADKPYAVGIGSSNGGPREQRPAGRIPEREALPTRLNELLRSRGSHDFGLPDVLRLAERTGLLPKQVIIWAIDGSCFQPEDVMSDETRKTALQAVNEITAELNVPHA